MERKEPITADEYTYTVLFEPEPEGGYTVTCPTLPGLVSYGETLDEARTMAAEAIACYLESLRKDGRSPKPRTSHVTLPPLVRRPEHAMSDQPNGQERAMDDVNLADAKARLSELVERAAAGHPVRIIRRGKPVAQITAVGTPRKRIDPSALRALTDAMPRQPEPTRDLIRRMRDGGRY